DLVINVTGGIVVYAKTIEANLRAELPFMATENLLVAAVQQGGDRQEQHEVIRRHSQAAAHRVKAEGAANDLLDRLRGDAAFKRVDIDAAMDPSQFIGRAPEQVDHFIAEIVEPIRRRYGDALAYEPTLKV